jgi:hypothetical protein
MPSLNRDARDAKRTFRQPVPPRSEDRRLGPFGKEIVGNRRVTGVAPCASGVVIGTS